jgi:2-(1,2-epoxy-1,2-dihydrophenyl)acetyl-CoA isomerase
MFLIVTITVSGSIFIFSYKYSVVYRQYERPVDIGLLISYPKLAAATTGFHRSGIFIGDWNLSDSMSEYDSLTVNVSDGVASVALDNPSKRNALDLQTVDELLKATTTLGEDSEVRCITLTHTGEFFGTGADLTGLSGDESDAAYIRQLAGRLHEAILQLHQSEIPVIGGVDGVAAGAGFSLTLLPDLLLLSEDAHLEFAYPGIGLTGDGGATFFLPRLVGLRAAKEIALLDNPLSPQRAVELGLATEVVPSDEFEKRLDELAQRLSSGPTHAFGKTTRLLTESFDRSLERQLAVETETMAGAIHTEDYQRGLHAFFEGEDPEFAGR